MFKTLSRNAYNVYSLLSIQSSVTQRKYKTILTLKEWVSYNTKEANWDCLLEPTVVKSQIGWPVHTALSPLLIAFEAILFTIMGRFLNSRSSSDKVRPCAINESGSCLAQCVPPSSDALFLPMFLNVYSCDYYTTARKPLLSQLVFQTTFTWWATRR